MALTPRLELRQSQSLVMTPQLQQAIKLLQLSNLDLAAFVEQELERNPLLERDEGQGEAAPEPETVARAIEERATDLALREAVAPPDAATSPLDADFSNVYDENVYDQAGGMGELGQWSSLRTGTGGEEEGPDLEAVATRAITLREHLLAQLQMALADPVGRAIGVHLIDLTDEAGYLTETVETIAERLGVAVAEIERVLAVLQDFEPAGVCARGLAECLALQLKEHGRLDPAMQALLAHLDLLARHDFAGLMRVCGVDHEDLQDMVAELRRLNPKPGLAFGGEVAQLLVPDVFVRRGPAGDWIVELNNEALPRILVNNRYAARIAAGSRADRAWISESLSSANWLVKSLEQRARTILRVASEIVRQQERFFAAGVRHLRPLNLRMVAEAIDMHESTVSRVTANKYMATPRGVFEMKYFFTAAIAAVDGGESHSAEAVRQRIRALIEGETAADVLSDDRIVELLHEEGIDIARRTVAKYRESMALPSSLQRRRLKKLHGKIAAAPAGRSSCG